MNALSYCMFMCDVTFMDNQRQDNCVVAGLQARESRIVVQFSGGNKFVSSPEHPGWLCKQPILLSSAEERLFRLWVQWLANIVLKLRTNGEIPPLPYVFMACTGTTLISIKIWAVCAECKSKDTNCSKHIARRKQRN